MKTEGIHSKPSVGAKIFFFWEYLQNSNRQMWSYETNTGENITNYSCNIQNIEGTPKIQQQTTPQVTWFRNNNTCVDIFSNVYIWEQEVYEKNGKQH